MRCREIRDKIDRRLELDSQARAHIESCESCRAYAIAADRLDLLIDTAKSQSAPPASDFDTLKIKIENEIGKSGKEITIMSQIKHQIGNHPRVGYSLLAAACLLAFMILVPFSYDRTVGYSVAFNGVDQKYIPQEELFTDVLNSLGFDRAEVDIIRNDLDFDCKISNLRDMKSAKEAAAAFNAVSGYPGEAVITPVVLRTSASLYAQVRDKLNKIEIDVKGKSNEEIKNEIVDKLRAQGFSNPRVTVESDSEGMRKISVGFSDSSETKQMQKEMELKFTGDSLSFDASHKIDVDTKGKTDDQIKTEIETKMKAQGFEKPEVTVQKDKDGQRRIEVKVENKEGD